MTVAERLDRARTVLVVVDVQEAFRPAIDHFDDVVAASATLIQGAQALGVPVVVTEQYPQGLGATVPELLGHLAGVERLPKTVFAANRADGFALGARDQVLLCGVEAHVCVSQTALDLLAGGTAVHIAADAVSSRTQRNRELGLRRVEAAGATITSVEMALFELVGAAGSEGFKMIQRLVK